MAFATTTVPPGVLSPTFGPPPPGAALEVPEGEGLSEAEPDAVPEPCWVTHRAAALSSGDSSTMA
ncbi:hypothetical protein [Streptomyces prunicolor]|uniref:Uncharacterized protein n=1 Tax=Streptomyces prunicolor TaxID=67348 RepID=A0ABU4FBC1_9ACTN|nr:hypothetical protein [Streptomyces prunicolor]MDV7217887.1 hypothetical protein [Streptomyces prunicolor]